MDVGAEGARDALDLTGLDHEGELFESINLEQSLDLVDGIAVRGHANAETVPGEGRIAVHVYSFVDIAVVVVVDRQIPVATVEANAMSQDLQGARSAAVWLTVCGRDLIVSLDRRVLLFVRLLIHIMTAIFHIRLGGCRLCSSCPAGEGPR